MAHKYQEIERHPGEPASIAVIGPRKIFSPRTMGEVDRSASVIVGHTHLSPDEARRFAQKIERAARMAEDWQEEKGK